MRGIGPILGGGISFYAVKIRPGSELLSNPFFSIFALSIMFPFGSLVEAINNAHPAHGILLWRLEIQICHQFLI